MGRGARRQPRRRPCAPPAVPLWPVWPVPEAAPAPRNHSYPFFFGLRGSPGDIPVPARGFSALLRCVHFIRICVVALRVIPVRGTRSSEYPWENRPYPSESATSSKRLAASRNCRHSQKPPWRVFPARWHGRFPQSPENAPCPVPTGKAARLSFNSLLTPRPSPAIGATQVGVFVDDRAYVLIFDKLNRVRPAHKHNYVLTYRVPLRMSMYPQSPCRRMPFLAYFGCYGRRRQCARGRRSSEREELHPGRVLPGHTCKGLYILRAEACAACDGRSTGIRGAHRASKPAGGFLADLSACQQCRVSVLD